MKTKVRFVPYIDDDERDLVEGIDAAIDAGEIQPRTTLELAQINAKWREIARNSTARKSITLRVQERDIERLKVMALRKGLPYQTLVASILHQFANGDLVER